jgi:uncharacterized cupredoxin-like copper-binding protein
MKKQLLLAAALALAGTASFAHGDAQPSGKSGAPAKEQKAWGIAGDARAATRTIAITMGDDMRFAPAAIAVNQGEVVKFVVKNRGRLLHEFVLGTKKDLDEHAALMVKFPNMEHDEPYMTHVKPGATGAVIWNFNRAGEFEFACLVAGHYQAGMVGKVTVAAAKGK